jgi:Tfp pilus assembly protein PilV
MLLKKNKRLKKGSLMVEVLIVSAIMTVSVLAALAVAQKSIYVSRQSLHVSQASFLLEEGAEAVRIIRDNDWSNIEALTPEDTYYPVYSSGTWGLSGTATQVGIFSRTVTIFDVTRDSTTDDIVSSGTDDPGTKLVTVAVSWDEGGTSVSKSISFYIADIF